MDTKELVTIGTPEELDGEMRYSHRDIALACGKEVKTVKNIITREKDSLLTYGALPFRETGDGRHTYLNKHQLMEIMDDFQNTTITKAAKRAYRASYYKLEQQLKENTYHLALQNEATTKFVKIAEGQIYALHEQIKADAEFTLQGKLMMNAPDITLADFYSICNRDMVGVGVNAIRDHMVRVGILKYNWQMKSPMPRYLPASNYLGTHFEIIYRNSKFQVRVTALGQRELLPRIVDHMKQ